MPTKTVDSLGWMYAERGDIAFDRQPPPNRIHPRYGFRSHAPLPRWGKPLNGGPRWGNAPDGQPRTLYYGVRTFNGYYPMISCVVWAFEGTHDRSAIWDFKDIGPPQGATITEAHLRFQFAYQDPGELPDISEFPMEIFAVKEVPVRFRLVDPGLSYAWGYHNESVPEYGQKRRLLVDSYAWGKKHTDAVVPWTVPADIGVWKTQNTPDISSVIQELVNLPEYAPSKPIALVVRPVGETIYPNGIDENYDWGPPNFDDFMLGWPVIGYAINAGAPPYTLSVTWS